MFKLFSQALEILLLSALLCVANVLAKCWLAERGGLFSCLAGSGIYLYSLSLDRYGEIYETEGEIAIIPDQSLGQAASSEIGNDTVAVTEKRLLYSA